MDIAAQSSKRLPLPHPSGQRLSTKRALAMLTVTLALFSGAAILSPVHAQLGGSQAVFTSLSGVCGVVDAATLTVVSTFTCDSGSEAVDVTSDGTRAVIGSCGTSTLALVDLTKNPPVVLSTIPSGASCVEELDIAPNNSFGIATGSGDGKVSKFTLSPFAVTGTGGPFGTGTRGGSPQDVHVDTTNTRAVLPMFDNSFLQIIDVTGTTPTAVATITTTSGTHHGISLSEADNDTILATGTISGVTVASRSGGSVTTVLSTGDFRPEAVDITCDGRRAVVETTGGLMWINMTVSPPTVLSSNFGAARTDGFSTSTVAFSRDGTILFVGGESTIDVYDATTDPPTKRAGSITATNVNLATLPCALGAAPVATDQSVTTSEDAAKVITLSATDADSPSLTFSIVTAPSHGTLSSIGEPSCVASGAGSSCTATVTYTPAQNYNGSESFTFKANDGGLDSNTATVSITVTPVNDAPAAASPPPVTTAEDTAVLITLSGSDIDNTSLTFAVGGGSGPSHGSLSASGGTMSCTTVENGTGTPGSNCTAGVIYTPALNYNGPDSFMFRVNDGSLNSNTATVSITVNSVNDPPVLTVPTAPITVNEGTPINFQVSATDVDGPSPLAFSVGNLPTGATLTPIGSSTPNAASAAFNWTPNSAQGGPNPYLVQISVCDGQLCDTKVVSITVNDTIADRDGDGVPDAADNCPDDPNPTQVDVCHNSPQPVAAAETVTQVDGQIPVTFRTTVTNDGKTDIAFLPPTLFTVNCKVINSAGNVVPIQQIAEAGPFVMNLGQVSRPGDQVRIAAKTTTTFSTTFDLKKNYYPFLPDGTYTTICTYVQFGQTLNPTADDPPVWTGEIQAQPQPFVLGHYTFIGFLSPLPDAKFSQTNTVPVKFRLKDSAGAFVRNCTCALMVQPLNSDGSPNGPAFPATSTSGSGNLFKYDLTNEQYVFNLSGRSLPVGRVQLQADLHDGSPLRTVNIVVTP